jgi:hypothetical protein
MMRINGGWGDGGGVTLVEVTKPLPLPNSLERVTDPVMCDADVG